MARAAEDSPLATEISPGPAASEAAEAWAVAVSMAAALVVSAVAWGVASMAAEGIGDKTKSLRR